MTTWNFGGDDQSEISATSIAEDHFRRSLEEQKNWYITLLESAALWSVPEERYQSRQYKYLIGGEAFDLYTLGERLYNSIDDPELKNALPENEIVAFLFFGEPPIDLEADIFAEILGSSKYSAYLNYWYGVMVEEALQAAVTGEIAKAKSGFLASDISLVNATFLRLYELDWNTLFSKFRASSRIPRNANSSLVEMKDFMYWLFRWRIKESEPARVASDTRKGITKLDALRSLSRQGALARDQKRKIVEMNNMDTTDQFLRGFGSYSKRVGLYSTEK
ncbi:MAG: hypothetical protein FI725_00830 [SAR202 cluster bacterium]|nr:hypothetical protein [SAR202 cluster bacterium]|tara:strand:- start:51 stop:881 length:831 start_codon:yes stop_codon:yes gene_type:complete